MNKGFRIGSWRLMIQTLALLFFLGLSITITYPLVWKGVVLVWFARLDPWLLLSQLRWQHQVPVWAWLPCLALIVAAWGGRLFCGWLCPLGGLLAWADKISGAYFPGLRGTRAGVGRFLLRYRYYWLFFIATVVILGNNGVLLLTPYSLLSHELGRIIHGAIPWVLLTLILSTLFWSRLWCSIFCPTGLLLMLTARWRQYGYLTQTGCTGCGQCTQICPVNAAPGEPGETQPWCLVCGDCRDICPVEAISYEHLGTDPVPRSGAPAPTAGKYFTRRQFAMLGITLAVSVALWKKMASVTARFLRPPGALPESEFHLVCSRCGRCVKVCPNQALWPLPAGAGAAALATPVLVPRIGRCDLCMACQEICPTGAIAPVPAEAVKIGRARVDQERCLAWSESRLCFICGEQCPFQAVSGDSRLRPTVLADRCAGCGACENGCPVDGEAAIRVYPL